MSAPSPATVFSALGDSTRLSLLVALRSGRPRAISRLTANTGMTRQGVTKHLRILEQAGLVIAERRGRETHYAYQPQALEAARAYLDAIAGRWEALGDALSSRPA